MTCELCGGQTTEKRVRKQHWLRGRLYVVENVAAEVCMECGERYFHAKTLDAIDGHLAGQHQVKERLQVEVVQLQPCDLNSHLGGGIGTFSVNTAA